MGDEAAGEAIVAAQDKHNVLISNDSTLKCKNERANNSGDV